MIKEETMMTEDQEETIDIKRENDPRLQKDHGAQFTNEDPLKKEGRNFQSNLQMGRLILLRRPKIN